MRKLLGILVLSLTASSLFAQIETNRSALEQFAKEQDAAWKQATERVEKYIRDNGVARRVELKNGAIREIVDVQDGLPVYFATDNANAAITTRADQLWPGGSLGIEITGSGFNQVGMWDGGSVRTTHQEFNNTGSPRVTLGDNAQASDHATHVAGTMVAGGVQPRAKGMAYEAMLKSYDWNNAESEMATAAAAGMLISNHSWGYITGWDMNNGTWTWTGDASVSPVEDYRFGYYDTRSRNWDQISRNAPYFLMVTSAGNDRGDGPSDAGSPGVPEKDGGEEGFDCIPPGSSTAKNTLTVGAVKRVLNYTGPGSVEMSSFSSWGPADDGRIKPDVVADGVGLYSSSASSNTSYQTSDGTSMSSPNATGTLVLLQQYYQQRFGNAMRSSTLKGLVIHTADECGPAEGPDYMFGWGLVNAERAATVIRENQVQTTIDEITLQNGGKYEREVYVSGNTPLRVTICWIDVESTVLPKALNNRTPRLVNDLNVVVIDASGDDYYPYKLNPDNPSAPATKNSKNHVDNVEHIYIATPKAGKYKIVVDHDGTLTGGSQLFSLIVSGIDEYTAVPLCTTLQYPEPLSNTSFVNDEIRWKEAPYATNYKIYFGTDGGGVTLPTNIHNGMTTQQNSFKYEMSPATTYYLSIQPENTHGINTGCNTIFSFTTFSIDNLPYFEDVENVTAPAFPTGWQAYDNSDRVWTVTTLAKYSGKNAFGCMASEKGKIDNMLVSPPIAVQAGHTYLLKFYYYTYPDIQESFRIVWGTFPTPEKLTNEIYNNPALSVSKWEACSVSVNPMIDGYIHFGFHLNSESGRGFFIDDILIADEANLNINENAQNQLNIRYEPGAIVLECADMQQKAEITVYNILGEQVLKTTAPNLQNERIGFNAVPGTYIVHLVGDGMNVSRKIIVTR